MFVCVCVCAFGVIERGEEHAKEAMNTKEREQRASSVERFFVLFVFICFRLRFCWFGFVKRTQKVNAERKLYVFFRIALLLLTDMSVFLCVCSWCYALSAFLIRVAIDSDCN